MLLIQYIYTVQGSPKPNLKHKEHTMACKNKWWPHNWFCLKGLYWIFVALFYFTLIYTIYIVIWMSRSPMISRDVLWQTIINFLFNSLSVMLIMLTVAAVLKALRKIKAAVAPCCCETAKQETVAVSVETEENKK